MKTKIAYLDYTWNPLAMRCTHVSPGCDHCWHVRMATRLAANFNLPARHRTAWAGGGGLVGPVAMREKELLAPLHWRKPRRVGVQFMGDLFHESVGAKWLDVFNIMARAKRHTFLVLTKRAERMAGLVNDAFALAADPGPLPNVWLGVTVENADYVHRLDDLMATPAAVRFVSGEPLLGPLDLSPWLGPSLVCDGCGKEISGAPVGYPHSEVWNAGDPAEFCGRVIERPMLDWVIIGGETGPGARPMDPAWVRDVRDQCVAAGVPFFFKQMSKKAPIPADLLIREFPHA